MDFRTFIIYFWGLSWLKFPLEAIWKLFLAFELFLKVVTAVSHWKAASEAFRQEQFSIHGLLSGLALSCAHELQLFQHAASHLQNADLFPPLFMSSWVWRREILQFCLGRSWTAGTELARRILGTGTLPFSKLDEQIQHCSSLMAPAFYKGLTWISSL